MDEEDRGPTIGARGVTFETRIAIAALLTAVVVLVTASGLFIFEQWQAERRNLSNDQAVLTQVLAGEIAPAMASGDAEAARRALWSVQAPPQLRVMLLGADGKPLARLGAPFSLAEDAGGLIRSSTPIPTRSASGAAVADTLVVATASPAIVDILPRYLAVCGALFFAATGLALFMGRWLAGRVIEPVNRLSNAMREVTDSGDYSERVPNWAQDEFGLLTDSFNHLLAQLQANDSALHRAMTELVAARDSAEAANVLKSQFLANMSHEIRTPLNGVLAMAQIIALGDLTSVQRERVEVIRRSGEDLLAVLNDVLDLSKIEAGKMEIDAGQVDAEVLGRNAQSIFGAVAAGKPDVRFSLDVRPEARGVRRGDAARLGQVLNNLVSNALKFTERGEVAVTIEGFGEDGRDGLRLVIRDTGIGIAADKLPQLFQKFSQADGSNTRKFGGTGLGLAISRELAQLMRGRIDVESVEGQGSVFTVTLPLVRIAESGAVPGDEAASTEAFDADERTLRVLAAEDIPTNQLVLRTIMETFGVDLEVVDNGRLAVEAWRDGEFDLVLMDIQMPEMDGMAATRAIRALEASQGRPRTPIIAVSANAMAHQVKEYMAVGMDGHVAKPIELTKLHAAIEKAMSDIAAREAA
jgi:signal transduction histidine kinase/ActR/RegA family two-component response regulator